MSDSADERSPCAETGTGAGAFEPSVMGQPYYDEDGITIYNCDLRDAPAIEGGVACVVTSPPYNVGIDYDDWADSLLWPEYWELAEVACGFMARALDHTGRCWVNVAPVVQDQPGGAGRNGGPHSGRSRKSRASLVVGWGARLQLADLLPCDVIAWASQRGSGTAWGSWQTPSAPNVRGDWEAILVNYKGDWPRTPPTGMESYRDPHGGWPALVSNVWTIRPETRNGHPAPFPVEVPARAIRLSTWPSEVVLDPFAGEGSTLVAAKQLGRRAIGIELSERYCEMAAKRLAQGVLFGEDSGVA